MRYSHNQRFHRATPLTYLTWGTVGFIFNRVIYNRKRGWWLQYVRRTQRTFSFDHATDNPRTTSVRRPWMPVSHSRPSSSSSRSSYRSSLRRSGGEIPVSLFEKSRITRPPDRRIDLGAVVSATLDAQNTAIQTVLISGTFGPAKW